MRTEIGVHPWAKYFQPYLNGELVPHCLMADEERGCVEVYHVDDRGRRLRPDKVGTRMLWGKVEDRPTNQVAERIKADPEHAQAIWDEYYEGRFGAMGRELAASGWPNKPAPRQTASAALAFLRGDHGRAVPPGYGVKLSDKQILRIMEVLDLRVRQLEDKRHAIDEELQDEVHEIRGILNTFSLERELRRLKKCR